MTTQGSPARKGDVLLLVGTRKGSFIISSDPARKTWKLSGPYSPGNDVFHLTYDPRSGRTFAAVNHMVWGPQLEYSPDLGSAWNQPGEQPRFSGDGGPTVQRLWHIEPGRQAEPGVVYAGVEPAALFRSEDDGDTWREVTGLSQHPSREHWYPGNGGLCLHSIVLDPSNPARLWTGVSAAGVFQSDDGGANWCPANQGVRADFMPDRFPEFGQCTHKLLCPPGQPGTLYQQNHCGVYRSDSGGQDWQDISEGLPSRFGFVLGLHSQDPQTLYVLPEDQALGDEIGGSVRYVSEGKMRVFRSRNGGSDWEPLTKGLPQQNAYLHFMREGMATDSLDPCGIYAGSTTGQIFYSRDDGNHWELLLDYLPPINSLECGLVA